MAALSYGGPYPVNAVNIISTYTAYAQVDNKMQELCTSRRRF